MPRRVKLDRRCGEIKVRINPYSGYNRDLRCAGVTISTHSNGRTRLFKTCYPGAGRWGAFERKYLSCKTVRKLHQEAR